MATSQSDQRQYYTGSGADLQVIIEKAIGESFRSFSARELESILKKATAQSLHPFTGRELEQIYKKATGQSLDPIEAYNYAAGLGCFRALLKASSYTNVSLAQPQLSKAAMRSLTCVDTSLHKETIRLDVHLRPRGISILPKGPDANHLLHSQPVPFQPTSMGSLSLPTEILCNIIVSMTYPDVRAFMQVNHLAWNTVINIREYQHLTLHAWSPLRYLFVAELNYCFSVADIHDVLTSPKCAYCPSFGGYVFLPGFVRICEQCARDDDRCVGIPKSHITKSKLDDEDRNYGLDERTLDNLPQMKTKPGRHSRRRLRLISWPLAQQALTKETLAREPQTSLSDVPQISNPVSGGNPMKDQVCGFSVFDWL